MIPEARIKIVTNKPISENPLDTPKKVLKQMQKLIGDEAQEVFVVAYLNQALLPLCYSIISKGGTNSASVSPAEVFKVALLSNATKMILFHNHPSGTKECSADDILITNKLATIGKMLGIEVIDHVIFTTDSMTSLHERGVIDTSDYEVAMEIKEGAEEFNKKYSLRIKEEK